MADAVAGLDAGFLLTETSTMPWQVLGVLVLDPSTAPEPFTFDTVRRLVAARLDSIEAFHKVIVRDPLSVWPSWADAEVDLDQHLHVADLPPDAGIADLEELAARIAEERLDRNRPLWEFHVVERLADGRAAIIAKVHHALADGVTAVGILSGLLDLEPLPARPVVDRPHPTGTTTRAAARRTCRASCGGPGGAPAGRPHGPASEA